MTVPTSKTLRGLVTVAFFAMAALAVLRLAGGPDLLGDWFLVPYAVLLLAWIGPDLRTEETPFIRWMLWIGAIGAAGIIASAFAQLLI